MPLTPLEFADILERGPLLLDGALGTELERRGIPCPAPLWSAAALRSDPESVVQIHREYRAAGARILVAGTFRTNPRTLQTVGIDEAGAVLNANAIAIARRAAADEAPDASGATRVSGSREQPSLQRPVANRVRDALIAASIGPVEDCYRPDLVPDDAALAREHATMVAWVRAARPDVIWIETMNTLREALAAARAVRESWERVGPVPFVVCAVLREDGRLLGGDAFDDLAIGAAQLGASAVGVNCIPPRGVTALLPRIARATRLPLVAYAHVGNEQALPGWSFAEPRVSPADYAAQAAAWLRSGARIVGGCCGTTPDHIAAVAALLE